MSSQILAQMDSREEAQRWNAGPREAEGDQALPHAQDIAVVADVDGLVLPVRAIRVTDRFRKDIGDISELAASILSVGLLQPIVVRKVGEEYQLIAGERRLRAYEALEYAVIPARVARSLSEVRDLLAAERDENTQRKPMLPSEQTALAMAIEELEKPAALDRQIASTKAAADARWGNASGSQEPDASVRKEIRARDIAAEAVGMSGSTFTRIKTMVTVAENEEEPEEIRMVAREALAAVDAGESARKHADRLATVRKIHKEAVVTQITAPKRANDPTEYLSALAELHPTARIAFEKDGQHKYSSFESFDGAARRAGIEWQFTERQWQARVTTSNEVLSRSALAIEVALSAIAERVDFSTITDATAAEALERLVGTGAIDRIKKTLKKKEITR